MLDTVKNFFAASPAIAWSIVGVMIAMVVMVKLWDQIKWWWLNTWVSFPLIGRIATLSKDINRDTDEGWFKAEKALCRDYKKFIRIQDEHDFNEKVDYLTKAGDNGRRPVPAWIWLLTVAMVFVEAMGFSYVLAGYTLPGASENLQQVGAYGIAFLISVILVALTHLAGHELFISNQIKNARRAWVEDGRKHKLATRPLPLARAQSVDDSEPVYTQLANRVGTIESYKISWLTAIFVAVVAIFATYVRGQVLEKTLHDETVGGVTQMGASSSGSDGLNMGSAKSAGARLPDADVAQNQAAKDKAMSDQVSIDRHGGWGTFIVLAFVFIFLQILGVIFGYRWGFAGQNSADAHRAIGGGRYATYADVREHYKEVADTAQAKLESLQQALMDNDSRVGTGDSVHSHKTFFDFMRLTRQHETRDRDDERDHTAQISSHRQPGVSDRAAPSPRASASSTPDTVESAVRKMESLQDKDAKKEYFHSLPQPMQQEVLKAIQTAKEAAKAVSKRAEMDAKLDDLL